MNWIKNKLIDPLKNQIIGYNPIRHVSRILGDSCLVLSQNMDQMTNDGNITFGRRMSYYGTFVIHLLVTIKYAILVIYDDDYTIAMLGESLHLLTNIYYCSRLCLSFPHSLIPVNLVTLALNSIIQCMCLINLFEMTFFGGVFFFLALSMAQLRYKEIIHLIKCNKVAGLAKISNFYNQLVIDIKM